RVATEPRVAARKRTLDGGLRGLVDRQLKHERRAHAGLRADREAAAHQLDELARDEQAEAAAADATAHAGVEATELLEDPRLLVVRDPEPLVADGEADDAVFRGQDHVDPAAARRILRRVLDEVGEHLAHKLGIPEDAR